MWFETLVRCGCVCKQGTATQCGNIEQQTEMYVHNKLWECIQIISEYKNADRHSATQKTNVEEVKRGKIKRTHTHLLTHNSKERS